MQPCTGGLSWLRTIAREFDNRERLIHGNGGGTRLMIRHRQAFHQFLKRYHTILDFSLFPLYPPPYGTNAPGKTLALLPCGAPAGKGTMEKAKDTCILNKRFLLRNQLTFARKRDTRKRAPSELYQERFLYFPFAFSFKPPSQERFEKSEPQASLYKRSVPNNSL